MKWPFLCALTPQQCAVKGASCALSRTGSTADNARWGSRPAHYHSTVSRSTAKMFASLGLLSLPHLHANPTGTTGPARILHISPRLPPLASPLPPQSIKMRRLAPTTPPCVLPVPFLSIGRRLAWQNRVHLPGFSRRSRHLYVSSKMQTALIFFVEYPLNFPFSSAILIGGTGYLYYRSSAHRHIRPHSHLSPSRTWRRT